MHLCGLFLDQLGSLNRYRDCTSSNIYCDCWVSVLQGCVGIKREENKRKKEIII